MAAARNKPSTDLADRVAAFFSPRLALYPQRRRVCVGLSGGRDSVALLRALVDARAAGLPVELSALHVNHGLSSQADRWSLFCTDLCNTLDVPLRCEAVVVSGIAADGLEAAARRARYAVFDTCAADWLALAHHRDDQAETLLLNLLRGAGVDGLAAMPEERALNAATCLVRPFLDTSREEIEAWVTARKLQWVEDDSNADTRLRRNFLRTEVLPLLATTFPDPAAALARAASHAGETAALADQLAVADAAAGSVKDGTLLLSPFNTLPLPRRTNLLRHFLRQHALRMPDSRYLAEIVRQLADVSPASAPVFSLDGAVLKVSRLRLRVCTTALPTLEPVHWQGEASLPWAGGELHFAEAEGSGLSQRLLQGKVLTLRPRQGGEHLQPDSRRPRRALKKLLQEGQLPSWERERLPLLWCGDDLAWVAGIGYEARFAAQPGEAGLSIFWERPATDR